MARTGGRRGEVGRTEILVGLAVLAVLVLITVPLIWSMARRSRREEVAENVEAIRQRELENMRTFSEYLAADAAPRPPHTVNSDPVPWVPSPGFQRLGWAPSESDVRGSYSVTVAGGEFVVRGSCDVDGDGHRAIYEATADKPASLTTDASIY